MPIRPEASPTTISLGDVLAQRYLGLELVVGGVGDLARNVTGAHAIEIANPSRWVSPQWIALTTGLRLKAKPDAQRELIDELARNGITALGFGLGINFQKLPSALHDQAQKVGFPLFTVPFSTGFAEVIAYVNQSLASPHLNSLLRFVSMQDYLLSSLSESSPLQEVSRRMSQLLSLRIVIVQLDGEIVDSKSSAPRGEVEDVIASLGRQLNLEYPRDPIPNQTDLAHQLDTPSGAPTSLELRQGSTAGEYLSTVIDFSHLGLQGTGVSVGVGERHLGWLIAIEESPLDPLSLHLQLPLLRSVAHLISVTISQRRSVLTSFAERRRTLLRELIPEQRGWLSRGDSPIQRPRSLSDKMLSLEFKGDEALLCVVLKPTIDQEVTSGASAPLCDLVSSWLSHLGQPFLLDLRKPEIIIVTTNQEDFEANLDTFCRQHGLKGGISPTVSSLGELPKALVLARYALSLVQHKLSDHLVMNYENLSLTQWVMGYAPHDILSKRQEAFLDGLADQPVLLETLKTYISSDLDVLRASQSLGVHPNSLRYRIAKVEERLSIALHRVDDLLDVSLALKYLPSTTKQRQDQS